MCVISLPVQQACWMFMYLYVLLYVCVETNFADFDEFCILMTLMWND